MSRFSQLLRFVVGVSMVAGGATLAAPFAGRLSTLVATAIRERAAVPQALPTPPPATAVLPATAVPPATATLPAELPAELPTAPPVASPPAPPVPASWPPAEWSPEHQASIPPPPGAEYQPPAPPAPLPPRPPEFAQPQPGLPNVYRSALTAPPPPLLDAHRPPPLAATPAAPAGARPITAPSATGSLPSTYRVRDGDDLAGIAARMYGHPAAAAAVWAANRDLISDPGLLPIGADLRLPPPWDIDVAGGSGGSGGIEPRRGTTASPALASVGGRIRVAPGDTLAAMAQRLYGDPAMARRIWELNRDQLRSPELVVPGMELRLPPLPQ